MRELRTPGTKSLVKQNLFVSIRQVVLSPNHVRDSHFNVVDHD